MNLRVTSCTINVYLLLIIDVLSCLSFTLCLYHVCLTWYQSCRLYPTLLIFEPLFFVVFLYVFVRPKCCLKYSRIYLHWSERGLPKLVVTPISIFLPYFLSHILSALWALCHRVFFNHCLRCLASIHNIIFIYT